MFVCDICWFGYCLFLVCDSSVLCCIVCFRLTRSVVIWYLTGCLLVMCVAFVYGLLASLLLIVSMFCLLLWGLCFPVGGVLLAACDFIVCCGLWF